VVQATRRETQIPFGNDNKNKDSASEEKAVRALPSGKSSMRKPQQGGWCSLNRYFYCRRLGKTHPPNDEAKHLICYVSVMWFLTIWGLDKKTWLADQPI